VPGVADAVDFRDTENRDDLILAAPGAVSSRLLAGVDSTLAALVGQIPHAGCSVAVLGVRRDQVAHMLDGFGFVVPAIEEAEAVLNISRAPAFRA